AVYKLIQWYKLEIKKQECDPLFQRRWAYGYYSNGAPIRQSHRVVYRDSAELQDHFPDPYEASGYLSWCHTKGSNTVAELEDQLKSKVDVPLSVGFGGKYRNESWH